MFEVLIVAAFIVLGYVVGRFLERKHYRSIEQRERELINLITTSSKHPVGEIPSDVRAELVNGACVISPDYFKQFVAGLRMLFGGNVRSYETLIDRARREAVLRLKESCPDANQIINLRIETSSITKGRKNQVGSVEVLTYATALFY
jgi:uncharacterized protein YbjQ (UPF0145 family)